MGGSRKTRTRNVDPEVVAERIWGECLIWPGEFYENCWRLSQRISPANFSASFAALFLQGFKPLHQTIHAQNSRPNRRHSTSEPHFLSRRFFCLRVRPRNAKYGDSDSLAFFFHFSVLLFFADPTLGGGGPVFLGVSTSYFGVFLKGRKRPPPPRFQPY